MRTLRAFTLVELIVALREGGQAFELSQPAVSQRLRAIRRLAQAILKELGCECL